jgi:hypothetical protein
MSRVLDGENRGADLAVGPFFVIFDLVVAFVLRSPGSR